MGRERFDTLCFGDGIDNPNRFPESTSVSDYLLNLWHGKTFTPYDSKAIQAKTIRFIILDVDENIFLLGGQIREVVYSHLGFGGESG